MKCSCNYFPWYIIGSSGGIIHDINPECETHGSAQQKLFETKACPHCGNRLDEHRITTAPYFFLRIACPPSKADKMFKGMEASYAAVDQYGKPLCV